MQVDATKSQIFDNKQRKLFQKHITVKPKYFILQTENKNEEETKNAELNKSEGEVYTKDYFKSILAKQMNVEELNLNEGR